MRILHDKKKTDPKSAKPTGLQPHFHNFGHFDHKYLFAKIFICRTSSNLRVCYCNDYSLAHGCSRGDLRACSLGTALPQGPALRALCHQGLLKALPEEPAAAPQQHRQPNTKSLRGAAEESARGERAALEQDACLRVGQSRTPACGSASAAPVPSCSSLSV